VVTRVRDHLQRAVLPRLVVGVSRWQTPRQIAAGLRRLFGQPLPVELYFAFDDPYAVIALPGLLQLLAAQPDSAPTMLRLYPLLQRGIFGDPAAAARAEQALLDARRLALRQQQTLQRSAPLQAADIAFLAAWCAAVQDDMAMPRFAAAALRLLWLDSDGEIDRTRYQELHRRMLGRAPGADDQAAQLAANAQRLYAKGHWESPAARVAGEWFLAHERLPQIARRLAQLRGAPP